MKHLLLFVPLAAVVFTGPRPAQAQDDKPIRTVTIEVTTNENGKTSRIEREIEADDAQAIQEALQELGVMDQFVLDDEDGIVTIDIQRMMKDAGQASEMVMKMSPGLDQEQDGAFLGVKMRDLTDDERGSVKTLKEGGAYVLEVVESSPAQAAGLSEADIIIMLDKEVVAGPKALAMAIRSKDPGTSVDVTYLRQGKKRSATVELGNRPAYSFAFAFGPEDDEHSNNRKEHMHRSQEPKAFLGVTPSGTDEEGVGAVIGGIEEGSAAQGMGIQEGDVIRSINERSVEDFDALRSQILKMEPGSPISIELVRGNSELTLTGKLGERIMDRFIIRELDGHDDRSFNEFHFDGPGKEELMELQQEMKDLRIEMRELQKELGKEVHREMRVTIEIRTLTDEEKALLTKSGLTDLDKPLELDDMHISPNPSNGVFQLRFNVPGTGDLMVLVHDITGQRVHEETIKNFSGRYDRSLDLGDQASGTYFLVIQQNGRSATSKLVRQ